MSEAALIKTALTPTGVAVAAVAPPAAPQGLAPPAAPQGLAPPAAPQGLAPPAVAPPPSLRVLPDPAEEFQPGARAPQPPVPRLQIPGYELSDALALEHALGVSHVLAQILVRRGLSDAGTAAAFLMPSESHDASEFDGIEVALAVIQRRIDAGARITVHGDYDVDGVCATAILVRALRSLGADVDWFLPSRIDDGYGLAAATVERLAVRGTRLLITVDCGITAVEETAAARAAGIDVVITDHHSPRADGALPDAPIVHPAVCGYPCPELCGTAVAFKLAEALGAGTAAEDVELVALATVADLVPLGGENRRLVRAGLHAMANTAKPGLRALMAVSRTDPSGLDAKALGFRLAPRINAAGRLLRADAGLELLLTDDEVRAAEVAAELDAANLERRAVEQRIWWEAEAQVAALGERSAYVLAAEGWHPGVIGIVASRVTERHHRPAILVALDGDAPAQGSGRSIPGFDLLGALHSAAGELIRYGGHRAAGGLTVMPERIDGLRAAVEAHAVEMLTDEQLTPVERIDAVASGRDLGMVLAEELELLEPCGMGNPSPRLLIPGARFGDLRPMGEGKHARFSVRSGGAQAKAVAFGCDGRLPGEPDGALDASFKLERNLWNGVVEPRLVLRHAQPCRPGDIRALGEPSDYLAAALAELDADLSGAFGGDISRAGGMPGAAVAAGRTVLDRRGEGPLAVLADALSCGASVLAVCAHVDRRLEGLGARAGGFSLVSHHALELEPGLADPHDQLVALDPPTSAASAAALRSGGLEAVPAGMTAVAGFTHLAWGPAELRFAEQMHELEYGLRTSLVSLYRALRERDRVAGEELERLLRGDDRHPRPARLAGRLIRVLAELELVSLDRDLPAMAIAGSAPTALERSAAFLAYQQRYEDGRRYLSSETHRRSV
jgi:single-stranded-DNA-specific exonuclease